MKKFYTIIIIIFLLILGGIGYFVYTSSNTQNVDSKGVFESVKNFFPFGNPTSQNQSTSTSQQPGQVRQVEDNKIVVERFFQISQAPVAGYVAIDVVSTSSKLFFATTTVATGTKKQTASSTKEINTFVRFMERATSHIYESKIPTLEKVRLSNNTTPKVYDAVFNASGTEVITRFLNGENISTVYNKLTVGTSTKTSLSSSLFPFSTDVVTAKRDSLFYSTRGTEGSVAYISTFDRKKPVQVFQTQLRDILAVWSGGDNVAVFSKPHSEYPGVAFLVDTKTGKSKQILSGINGLTALPNLDASYVLFNSDSKNINLAVQKVSNNTTFSTTLKSLPEKCVWSKIKKELVYCAVPTFIPEAGYPEKWYQGSVSFNDNIWSIDVETGEQKNIYSPLDNGKPSQDATNLTLNDKENYLFFTNKKDLSLWGLSLE